METHAGCSGAGEKNLEEAGSSARESVTPREIAEKASHMGRRMSPTAVAEGGATTEGAGAWGGGGGSTALPAPSAPSH